MKARLALIRDQLEQSISPYRQLRSLTAPPKGWIRAIRNALGMSSRQLAERLSLTKQRISVIERQETSGSVTMRTMQKTADALNCDFVYCLVPRQSLDGAVRERAEEVAGRRIAQASHTMALEDQSLSSEENRRILSDMVDDICKDQPADLWNNS